jgi:alpha-1,2-mannosyltransferase
MEGHRVTLASEPKAERRTVSWRNLAWRPLAVRGRTALVSGRSQALTPPGATLLPGRGGPGPVAEPVGDGGAGGATPAAVRLPGRSTTEPDPDPAPPARASSGGAGYGTPVEIDAVPSDAEQTDGARPGIGETARAAWRGLGRRLADLREVPTSGIVPAWPWLTRLRELPWLRRRSVQIGWRALTLVGLAIGAYLFLRAYAVRHGFFDLKVYYGALNYWVNGGGSIYDYLLPKSTYGFTYPPFAALVMVPMAVTPWTTAIVVSATACVATTAVLLYWLIDPIARRSAWTRWFALGVTVCLASVFEPLRETFLFGQVNMLLVFLVGADLVLLVSRRSRWGGIGIGLATAVKLTPGIFILYLFITKRWRAGLVASATAAVTTVVAAAIVPDASRVFWTDALWNTDRVGALAFISNQSLNGAVARLNPGHPSTALWGVSVLVVLAIWIFRVRRSAAVGDEMTGFALTGIVGCLCSPITWIHHLVWVGPAIILLLDNAMATRSLPRRLGLLAVMAGAYAMLSSRFVWDYSDRFTEPADWFNSNAYVWVSLGLLVLLPVRRYARDTTPARSTVVAVPAKGRELAGVRSGTFQVDLPRPVPVETGHGAAR